MSRRQALVAGAACLLCASCAAQRASGASRPAEPAGVDLATDYLTLRYQRDPERGDATGWPLTDHGAVRDRSLEAERRWQRVEDQLLERARAIDPARLDGPRRTSHGIVVEALLAARDLRACRRELWDVSSVWGWQATYAGLADVQPVGTPELRAQAVARLRGLARSLGDELGTLREGVRLGYVATRENVERVVKEMDVLLATAPAETVFVRPALRDPDPAFRLALAAAVDEAVLPAIRRYRDFLAAEYLPRARIAIGVSALPDGGACYRAAVRAHLSLDVPPRVIHQVGTEQVARVGAEMQALAERSFHTGDVPALLARLRTDPAYTFASREEMLAVARAAVARAVAAVPRVFGRVPRAPVSVEPFPDFMAGSAPSDRYQRVTAGGELRGIWYLNDFEPRATSRAGLESTAFHETVPGHHLQSALALETPSAPAAGRYLWTSGFGEGWALYAERLADELGLYASELDRMGMLSDDALRAARLVVDSGMHALGWSRQQAIDYLLAHTTVSPEVAASEIDRYAANPGQAVSYMLGRLEILRLREEAQRRLGPRFDLRAFHDAVLEDGTIPLRMLREKMTGWQPG